MILKWLRVRRGDELVMRGSQSRVAQILLFVNRYLNCYSNERRVSFEGSFERHEVSDEISRFE